MFSKEVQWEVTLEEKLKKQFFHSGAMSARSAELEAKKLYPNATVLNVERTKCTKKGQPGSSKNWTK